MDARLVTAAAPSHAASAPETEAAVWLARLHADDRSSRDDRAFRAWLAADAANRRAFDHLTAVWDLSGGAERRPYAVPDRSDAGPTRRRVMLGAGAAVIAGGGFAGWSAAVAGVYETRLGEQRHVALDDGSSLFLDTDTRLRVDLAAGARTVVLDRGRCNFRVAPDPRRPFVVDAGARQIVTPRATFDVRRDGDVVAVTCLAGSARVAGTGQQPAQPIAAGERLVAAPGTGMRTEMPNIAAAVAWQSGQVVFDDDPLTAVATEMNRYSRAKLRIAGSVGALRVSGSYRVGDNLSFAQSLTHLLPVQARRDGTDIELSQIR